ncbi:MAG: hypothetical protein MHPSP_001495, partial [Paramarteilia canceri]
SKIFMGIDESEINHQNSVVILVGKLNEPGVTHLFSFEQIFSFPTATMVTQIVDETMKNLNAKQEKFLLYITDATRFMISAGNILKIFTQNISHLLHNVFLIIRTNFSSIDLLISAIKSEIVKIIAEEKHLHLLALNQVSI